MSCTVIRPKDRAEWLKYREDGIGSSEVGTLLGLNPFETPYQLWRRKKGLDAPKEETFVMKAGHYLEDAVSKFYEDESGRQIIKRSAGDWMMIDNDKSYLRVSPDRLFWLNPEGKHNEANKGICECKTTQMKVDADNIPDHWFCQLQYQLHVAGYEMGSLAWLTQGREFGYRDIEHDEDFCRWMVEQIDEFWLKYIIGSKEPPAYNATDVVLKCPRHIEGKTVEATEEVIQKLDRLHEIKEICKPLDKEAEELTDDLKMFFGDAESIISEDGKVLATWKAPKPKLVFDKVLFENSVGAEEFGKYCHETQGARRFVVK